MIPFRTKTRSVASGFSLVELLIVVAIFLIITSIVLFSQNKFSSDISISNVAYQIALEVRQAQVYGILVRKNQDDFNSAYGLHFYKDGNELKFLTFADNSFPDDEDDALVYDDADSILATHALEEGNVLSRVCTYDSIGDDDSRQCFSPSDDELSSVDIVFKRPEPAALITDSSSSVRKGEVEITVTSSLGDRTRTVKVFGTGQISVYAN